MTDQSSPITPPLDLVQQWKIEGRYQDYKHIATRAAQWGADQELEACCEALHQRDCAYLLPSQLRAARRPRPPSLKERALGALEHLALGPDPTAFLADMDTIRRALEALPND